MIVRWILHRDSHLLDCPHLQSNFDSEVGTVSQKQALHRSHRLSLDQHHLPVHLIRRPKSSRIRLHPPVG